MQPILGSAAVEGPVIEWVSTHRKHHRFTDRPGDPHSPHTEHGVGFRGALRGLFHAHVGWMFRGIDRANPKRYAKDLLGDPIIRAIDRTFPGQHPDRRSDHRRCLNLAWLAIPTFGEAWHNNHHAFPTSAHHGLTRAQLDPGGWLIDALERLGLAWDVIRIEPTDQQAKLTPNHR